MNIDNIEKCQKLLATREKYLQLAKAIEDSSTKVRVQTPYREIVFDEDLLNDMQDAIAARVADIDSRLATL